MVFKPTPPRAVTPKAKILRREYHRSQTALALPATQQPSTAAYGPPPSTPIVDHHPRRPPTPSLNLIRNASRIHCLQHSSHPLHPTTMNQHLPSQLRRYPSASQSPSDAAEGRDHYPALSSQTSSNSVYELPANSAASTQSPPPPPVANFDRARNSACQSLNEKSSDEVIGTLSGLSKVNSTKASGYHNSLRRPGPPPLSQTMPDVRTMNPSLRQSASFSIGDRTSDTTPPPPGSGLGTPKRYSDEAKNAAPWKKKGSFSSFMTTVLGSPRGVKISNPENPVHVTHVGFDNETGQFTVSRITLESFPIRASRSLDAGD